jgi:hypothetical protein
VLSVRKHVFSTLNPYNPCVASKTVNGTQMTVCWHVDDLKVSHVDPKEVRKFGKWLSKTYGVSVATHRGKVHDYLGMIFDFSEKGKVMINMIEYLKNISTTSPKKLLQLKQARPPTISSLCAIRLWRRRCQRNMLGHFTMRQLNCSS